MIPFLAGIHDGRGNRQRIIAAIRADPGIHVSLLAKRVGLSWRTTLYHVVILQGQGVIDSDRKLRERRLFPTEVPALHRAWLSALRNDNAIEVLRLLAASPLQSIPDLSHRLGSSEKVVRRQVANLVNAGLVERHGHFRPTYEPTLPGEELQRLLGEQGTRTTADADQSDLKL